jgi:hypothetical protein
MSPAYRFIRSTVGFIDILGFSRAVLSARKESVEHHDRVIAIVRKLAAFEAEVTDETGRGSYNKISTFSDCVLLSEDVEWVIRAAWFLYATVLLEGFLMRGGIVEGELYHEGGVVVGPALIEAYQMESTLAVYPRLVVDERIVIELARIGAEGTYLRRDQDGMCFVDVLARQCDAWKAKLDQGRYLGRVREILIRLVADFDDNRVRMKIDWFINYFNKTLRRYEIRSLARKGGRKGVTCLLRAAAGAQG